MCDRTEVGSLLDGMERQLLTPKHDEFPIFGGPSMTYALLTFTSSVGYVCVIYSSYAHLTSWGVWVCKRSRKREKRGKTRVRATCWK